MSEQNNNNIFTKSCLLACSNSVVQYFNYAIFGLSALQLSNNFMPGVEDKNKLLNFFAAIILTVIARPLGSLFIGHMGDKFGRKLAVTISGLISSIGVLIVTIVPNYHSIGIIASLLLIFSRMIFLSGLSGEIDGVRLYISENISKKRQNFGNGIVTFSTQLGALAASFLLYTLASYKDGWRICFVIGGFLGIILTFVRNYLTETIEFTKSKKSSEYIDISFTQIIYGQMPLLLKTILISGTIGTMYQFFIIFLPIYLKLDLSIYLTNYIPVFIASYGFFGIIWGSIADKIGGYSLVRFISILIIITLLCLYFLLEYQLVSLIPYLIISASSIISGFSVPSQIILKQNINVGIRYRIFSVGHSLGSLLFSTPTCFICTKIAMNYNSLSYALLYPISMIILGCCAICSISKSTIRL